MTNHQGGQYNLDQPVRAFVKRTLIGIKKGGTVQEAARKMGELGVSSMVVTDGVETVGFFTDSDINRKVVAEGLSPSTPVEDIMNEQLITIDIGASVRKAVEVMTEQGVKHLLVTSKGKIVAVLTFGDIFAMERHIIGTHISRE
jgi:CBS domain-containing protein